MLTLANAGLFVAGCAVGCAAGYWNLVPRIAAYLCKDEDHASCRCAIAPWPIAADDLVHCVLLQLGIGALLVEAIVPDGSPWSRAAYLATVLTVLPATSCRWPGTRALGHAVARHWSIHLGLFAAASTERVEWRSLYLEHQRQLLEATGGRGVGICDTLVTGPILEELVFCGLLFRYLHSRLGHGRARNLVTVCFGALHWRLGWASAVCAAWLSLCACESFAATGSLATPVLLHVANNARALLCLHIAQMYP